MTKIPYIPDRFLRGYLGVVLQSVTVEIHRQCGRIKKDGRNPARVLLGPLCSRRFAYEQNQKNPDTSKAPRSYNNMTLMYNCNHYGVIVLCEKHKPP